MRLSVRNIVGAISLLLISGATTNASVFLSFTNNGATPTSVSVSAGSSFPVQLKLTSTTANAGDMVTALDYFLQSQNGAQTATVSGVFTIASRNTATDGTPFGLPNESDSAASAGTAAVLNPQDATNLGASLTNITDSAVSNTTVVVADYVISVAANATPGNYTLTTYDPNPNQGYVQGPPNYSNSSFSNQGAYSVTVTPAPTPEPGVGGLLVLAGIAGLCRRSRRVIEI